MAKVYQLLNKAWSQAEFDKIAHSIIFAESRIPTYAHGEGDTYGPSLIVTSNVESEDLGANYIVLGDDSQSEVSVDISTGKFVEGNLIATVSTVAEAQSDLRDFMTFYNPSGDLHLHVGICNTTQSQDYTPAIIENSRVIKMMSPAQVESLGL